jgi:hypothetical protein
MSGGETVISLVSLAVSSATAVLVVVLSRRQDEKMKRLEARLRKEDALFDKLLALKDTVVGPIGKMQGDLTGLAFALEQGEEVNQASMRQVIDACSDRIGFVASEYDRCRYLFSQNECDQLDALRETYQARALENDVLGAFRLAVEFHEALIERLDAKIASVT